jgi:flagellar biosynthesis protein FliR
VPAFVLVFFRIAGMMLFAPLFGSARIPKRVRVMLALVLALGLMPGLEPQGGLPADVWTLTLGIAGEIIFGLALGMVLGMVFIGAQMAGEVIGQQMGLGLSQVFDPQFGQQTSLVGEMYFMFAMVIFLLIDGHHAMLHGLRASFDALPLLSVGLTPSLLELLIGLLQACMGLAVRLAAPVLVTMLVVELALGFISKTMPQVNVLTAGLPLRAVVGMIMLVFSVMLTSEAVRGAIVESMEAVRVAWSDGSGIGVQGSVTGS